MNRLTEQTVIITGSAGGIGSAIARHCLAAGAAVLACDCNTTGLARLAAEFESPAFELVELDVSVPTAVATFFARLGHDLPLPTALVNNAGIYPGRSILEYTPAEIERLLAVNISGAVHCAQHFGRLLLASQTPGTLVNISSVAGQEGSSDALYGLSKAALIGLTKSLAMNFAPLIRVNAVAPGLVDTSMLDRVPKARLTEYRAAELVKEPISPAAVAASVAFLLSDDSRHCTGMVLDLNNGCYRR